MDRSGSDSRGRRAAAAARRGRSAVGLSILVSLMALSGGALGQRPTAAQSKTMAEALFREGERLFLSGEFDEACPKLAESQELDPALGTAFKLAECYEKQGRIASAWSLYLEVAAKISGAGDEPKAEKIRKRAADIEPKLPKMAVEVPQSMADLPGIEVRRDGVLMGRASWGVALPVDPGKRTVRVTATGKEPWEVAVEAIRPGEVVPVRVPVLKDLPPKVEAQPALPPNPKENDANPKESRSALPMVALALGGVGLVGVGVGSVFGVMALNKASEWDERTRDTSRCRQGADGLYRCNQGEIGPIQEIEASRSAFATASTIGFIAGGAALAGGVVLWLAASSPERKQPAMRLVPAVGADGAAVSLHGSF